MADERRRLAAEAAERRFGGAAAAKRPKLSNAERLRRADIDDDQIQHEFRCAITLEVMDDPVVASDGHTYERHNIQAWFAKSRPATSPKTQAALESTHLTPNLALKTMIQDWVDKMAKPAAASSDDEVEFVGMRTQEKVQEAMPQGIGSSPS